jgi:hypothetical protein
MKELDMAKLAVTPLVSGGYLVEGQDSKGVEGSTILKSDRWDYVQHLRAHEVADADFEKAVEKFFKPLTDAAEKAKAAVLGNTNELGTITVGEVVEGKSAQVIELDEAGILLRLIDEGKTDQLRWVGGNLIAVA